jgi:hypothetical protein
MQRKIHASTSASRGSVSMDVLVGSTGLIGSVLREYHDFDCRFNSENIHLAPLLKDDIDKLYLACLPAEKWKANQAPMADFDNMYHVLSKIRLWSPKEIILYSTIDIYNQTYKYVENFPETHAINYGSTRYIFELLVKATFPKSVITIIRLPALFHKRIKKNILFDLLNSNNIEKINANSCYQWYDLKDLWLHTEACQKGGEHQWFSEPIETLEIIDQWFPWAKTVVDCGPRIEYNYGPYFSSKETTLKKMEAFINAWN